MKRFRHILLGFLASLAVLPLAAQQPFVFTPQWTAQAQFAGYYVAKELGYYQEEGLDVRIVHHSTSKSQGDYLREGLCDATTLQLMQAIELVDSGLQLVNILQTSMNNATLVVSRRGKDPLQQKGAVVGNWKSGFSQVAFCMNAREGLGYRWVPQADHVNLFVAGAIDATLVMTYNEYYQLLQAGQEIREDTVFRFSERGYNIQEDGVYMSLAAYRKDPDRAERFVRASRKGWEWTAAHPEEALDIVMRYVQEGHVATNRVLQKLMLDEILRLQVDAESQQREFRLRPDMVRLASEMMLQAELISKPVTPESLLPR
ncbi:MAG: ABC transporter substrate-binding protein [Bacteroidales bacterium]|nr:ABC transporter substrate-binding protein [Bacteroidales bacterium]